MPIHKAYKPAVTAQPKKPAQRQVRAKPAAQRRKLPGRTPVLLVSEPVALTEATVTAAAWNVIMQIRHLHVWRPTGRSCECRLCALARSLQAELLRSGSKDPEDAKEQAV